MQNSPHIRKTHQKKEPPKQSIEKKNLFIKLIDLLNKKFSRPVSHAIAIGGILIITIAIVWGAVTAVNAYIDEMERLKQIQIEEEERQRIAEEEEARRRAEQEALEKLQKEYDAVMHLKTLNLAAKNIPITPIMQYPEYDAGCEPMALTNMLKYYGFPVVKNTIISNYLVFHRSNFVDFYMGDTRSVGWEMSPGITAVCKSFLTQNGSTLRTYNVSGRSLEELFAYVERGHPVEIWTSLSMSGLGSVFHSYQGYKAYENSHTVLLTGFDRASGTVYICDSIYGNVSYPISRVINIYNMQQAQAVVIISQEELDLWIQGIDASYDNTIPPYVPPEEDEEDSEE